MRIPQSATNTASGLFTPFAVMFLQDAFKTMLPWIMVMLSVVICDLIAGLRKSIKLGVHISWSMAFRETMGKMVTYVAFVLMVAMIDAASNHSFHIAMWGCLFICALEGGSIISNLLKPYGIDITPKNIFKFVAGYFASKVLQTEPAEVEVDQDQLEAIKERERKRWEQRDRHHHGTNIKDVRNVSK